MTYPIGPVKTFAMNRSDLVWSKTWRTQAKPYDLVLPFSDVQIRFVDGQFGGVRSSWNPSGLVKESLYTQVYERLRNKVRGDTSSLGTFFGELGESVDLINHRGRWLFEAARMAQKRDVGGLLKHLFATGAPGRTYGSPRKLPKSSDAASLWLEYSFGWKPALDDVFGAMTTMASYGKLGHSAARVWDRTVYREVFWDAPNRQQYALWQQGVSMALTARMDNPNLWLASRLGLLNPVQVVWQLVPWSFLVDRFVNISTVLGSFTDFAGVTLTGSSTSTLMTWDEFYTDPSVGVLYMHQSGRSLTRVPSLHGPSIALKPVTGLRPVEGVNYMALLAQKLKSF